MSRSAGNVRKSWKKKLNDEMMPSRKWWSKKPSVKRRINGWLNKLSSNKSDGRETGHVRRPPQRAKTDVKRLT